MMRAGDDAAGAGGLGERDALQARHNAPRLVALQRDMGYTFKDESLLSLALTHPSVYAQSSDTKPDVPQDNQRLEFLGDAVVQMCVSEALYTQYPGMREGEMTRARISLVRKETLSEAARRLRLGERMRMGGADREQGLGKRLNVLCDVFEAVTAAVYLDGGMDNARAFLTRTLNNFSLPAESRSSYNWKSALQELMQAEGQHSPTYKLVSMTGPPHEPLFVVDVRSQSGEQLGQGSGSSRKAAEQQAAYAASRLFMSAKDMPDGLP